MRRAPPVALGKRSRRSRGGSDSSEDDLVMAVSSPEMTRTQDGRMSRKRRRRTHSTHGSSEETLPPPNSVPRLSVLETRPSRSHRSRPRPFISARILDAPPHTSKSSAKNSSPRAVSDQVLTDTEVNSNTKSGSKSRKKLRKRRKKKRKQAKKMRKRHSKLKKRSPERARERERPEFRDEVDEESVEGDGNDQLDRVLGKGRRSRRKSRKSGMGEIDGAAAAAAAAASSSSPFSGRLSPLSSVVVVSSGSDEDVPHVRIGLGLGLELGGRSRSRDPFGFDADSILVDPADPEGEDPSVIDDEDEDDEVVSFGDETFVGSVHPRPGPEVVFDARDEEELQRLRGFVGGGAGSGERRRRRREGRFPPPPPPPRNEFGSTGAMSIPPFDIPIPRETGGSVITVLSSSEEDEDEDPAGSILAGLSGLSAPTASGSRSPSQLPSLELTQSQPQPRIRMPIVLEDDHPTPTVVAPVRAVLPPAGTATDVSGELQRKRMEEEASRKADECPICLDEIDVRGMLDCCDHHFCMKCITRWSKDSNRCPVCKERYSKITPFDRNPIEISSTSEDEEEEEDGEDPRSRRLTRSQSAARRKKLKKRKKRRKKRKKKKKKRMATAIRVPRRDFHVPYDPSEHLDIVRQIQQQMNTGPWDSFMGALFGRVNTGPGRGRGRGRGRRRGRGRGGRGTDFAELWNAPPGPPRLRHGRYPIDDGPPVVFRFGDALGRPPMPLRNRNRGGGDEDPLFGPPRIPAPRHVIRPPVRLPSQDRSRPSQFIDLTIDDE